MLRAQRQNHSQKQFSIGNLPEKCLLLAYSIKHSLQKLQRHEDHLKNEDYDEGDLRYGKICILADADVDGSHIQVLLITLFLKHFPGLVKNGRLFVAQPPLYRIDIKGKYRKEFGEKVYVRDENELQKRFKKFDQKQAPNPSELKWTTHHTFLLLPLSKPPPHIV